MTNQYAPQNTLQYSTFIKRAVVESLAAAFKNHPMPVVASSRVEIDFRHDRWQLPGIIVKFYERTLPSAGVGHVEYLISPQDPNPSAPTMFVKYYHRMYEGDISFEIWAQSSVDRDLLRDALIEVLTMTDATTAGNAFLTRFYDSLSSTPYGQWHFPVLMLDILTGYGEQQTLAPWRPEDMLVYQVGYRVPIFGEFYSNTPTLPSTDTLLQEVDVYPYIAGVDPTPEENPDEPGNPDWLRFTGWPPGTETI